MLSSPVRSSGPPRQASRARGRSHPGHVDRADPGRARAARGDAAPSPAPGCRGGSSSRRCCRPRASSPRWPACGRSRTPTRSRSSRRSSACWFWPSPTRVRFDTPLGFTVPTQLAFVPLVFAVPPAIVPIAVALAFAMAMAPEIAAGQVRPSRLMFAISNSWFSIGPVAVLAIAQRGATRRGRRRSCSAPSPPSSPSTSRPAALHVAITRDGELSSLLRASWIYGVDAALSATGLLAAENVHHTPLAALAMVPLLGLLAVFAQERRRRLREHARAVERLPRDRARPRRRHRSRRRLHRRALQERRRAHARARRASRPERRAAAQPRVRRAPARRGQDRHPQGDHQQARQARPPRVDDRQDPHARGPEDARPRRRVHARRSARSCAPTTSAGTAAATPTGWPASRSRSRPGSSRAATPGTRCAPTVPTARRSRTRSRRRSCARPRARNSIRVSSRSLLEVVASEAPEPQSQPQPGRSRSAQMQPVRHSRGLSSATHAKLAEDPRDVHAGRLLGHEQRRPDLTVGRALGEQRQHLTLARGEPERVLARAGAV